MKTSLVTLSILAFVGLVVAVGAGGASTANVGATVTPKLVSVSVSPASVDYGTLDLSTSDAVRTTAESGTIVATNNGNITENLGIKGSNSTNWTLSSTPAATGTVGAGQFAHRFDEGAIFTNAEAAALDSSAYKTLKNGVAKDGTGSFVLQMNMPVSSSTYLQQSTTVTVLATE